MQNRTKKAIMLGVLLLGCGTTSLVGSLLGNSNKTNVIAKEQQLLQKEDNYSGNRANQKSPKQRNMMKIYVSGAVAKPGLFDVPQGARADDAVRAAGGMLELADTQKVNLALKLKDGMQVNVPFAKGSRSYGNNVEANTWPRSSSTSLQQTASSVKTINLNTASAQELEALPGIGPSMAQRIMEYRQKRRFNTIEDLVKVPGIGKAKLNRLKGRICV